MGFTITGGNIVVSTGNGITTAGGTVAINAGASLFFAAGQVGVAPTWVYFGNIIASQITAGTISAAVLMTSPALAITSTSGATFTVNIDSVAGIKVVATSVGWTTQIAGGGVALSSASLATTIAPGLVQLFPVSGGGALIQIDASVPQISIGGNKVLGPRQTGVGTLSTGATLAQVVSYVQLMAGALGTSGQGLFS